MIGRTSLFLACFALSILAGSGFSRAAPVLSAGSATINVGEMVTIPISITGAAGLTSFQFDLAFTPAIVEVLSVDDTSTDFATEAANEGGFLVGITAGIDNNIGLLSLVADSMSGNSGPGLTPSGTIANITFEALAPGTTALTLANAFLTDGNNPLYSGNGDFAVSNGSVTVSAAPAPGSRPSSAVLGAVLLALAIARRPRPSAPGKIDR
jgi:MYXO-CTERM domain-containing protein